MIDKLLTKQDIIAAAKECLDPELDLDIWTLGLIYEMKITEHAAEPHAPHEGHDEHAEGEGVKQDAYVRMTFTSPMCPFGRELTEQFKDSLYVAGFEKVKIDVVFDPPWTPSPEVKEILGIS